MIFGGFGGGRDDEDTNPFAALLMIIVAPIAATLIQLAIARHASTPPGRPCQPGRPCLGTPPVAPTPWW